MIAPGGARLMAGGALAFSIMALLVKLAGQRLPTQEIVLARSIVVALISYTSLRVLGVSALGQRRPLLVLRGLFGFGALTCFYYAVIHLPLADATVIQYTNPAFTLILAAPFLGETLRWREAGLVALCLAGVVLMTRPALLFGGEARLDPLAVAVGLTGAILSASAYVVVRELGRTEHPLVIVLYFAAISTLCSAVPVALNAVAPTPAELLLLGGVGVTTHIGQVLITKGLGRERAGRATAVGYLQVLFAAALGLVVFAEMPDAWVLGGAVLVAGGVFAIAQPGRSSAIQRATVGSTQEVGRQGGPDRNPT